MDTQKCKHLEAEPIVNANYGRFREKTFWKDAISAISQKNSSKAQTASNYHINYHIHQPSQLLIIQLGVSSLFQAGYVPATSAAKIPRASCGSWAAGSWSSSAGAPIWPRWRWSVCCWSTGRHVSKVRSKNDRDGNHERYSNILKYIEINHDTSIHIMTDSWWRVIFNKELRKEDQEVQWGKKTS